jgi:hypothetical protein
MMYPYIHMAFHIHINWVYILCLFRNFRMTHTRSRPSSLYCCKSTSSQKWSQKEVFSCAFSVNNVFCSNGRLIIMAHICCSRFVISLPSTIVYCSHKSSYLYERGILVYPRILDAFIKCCDTVTATPPFYWQ